METITPFMSADTALMQQHLGMLFGRAMRGRVEITAIKAAAKDEHVSPRTKFFNLDQLDEAAEWAASVNAEPGWNVYVGAALRRDDVFPGKAADDGDFLEAWALWADCDDEEQVVAAQAIYQELHVRPPFIVVTGRTPGRRAQLWWPLESALDDAATLKATVRGIADKLGTDHAVLTAKQLMRLAGGVAWPKPNKPGRVLEMTELVLPVSADQEFALERMQRLFPVAERPQVERAAEDAPGTLAGAMAQRDLRSALASMRADDRDLWIRMGHALKGLGDIGRGLWLEWSQTSDKYDAADAARVWDSFKPQHTGYQAVFAEAQRGGWANPGAGAQREERAEPGVDTPDDDTFEVLSISDIRAMPDAQWVIKDAIPATGLVFFYGPPATYKSFVCYDLALSLAYGAPHWLGHERRVDGSVLYIASEGVTGAKNRIQAWQQQNGVAEDTDRFHLIRKTINFLAADDRDRLVRTVKRHIEAHGPVALIFVDTVSRVLPGADENLQKDMTVFVGACDALREFGATVVGVHHTNKQGDMRGSTVFLGQGDAVFRVEREEGARTGVLTCEKQKDAEDGWRRAFEVHEQSWMPPGRLEAVSSLAVAFGGEPRPEDPAATWPGKTVCREVLKSIDEAWSSGSPLSPYRQAKREGKWAPRTLSAHHYLPIVQLEMMIEEWLVQGVLTVDIRDTHSKAKGLKVLKWLD